MEQVDAKRVVLFVVVACFVGMVFGSAVTLAGLNVQRAIPSSGSTSLTAELSHFCPSRSLGRCSCLILYDKDVAVCIGYNLF